MPLHVSKYRWAVVHEILVTYTTVSSEAIKRSKFWPESSSIISIFNVCEQLMKALVSLHRCSGSFEYLMLAICD